MGQVSPDDADRLLPADDLGQGAQEFLGGWVGRRRRASPGGLRQPAAEDGQDANLRVDLVLQAEHLKLQAVFLAVDQDVVGKPTPSQTGQLTGRPGVGSGPAEGG